MSGIFRTGAGLRNRILMKTILIPAVLLRKMQNLLEKLEFKLIGVYENKHGSKKLIDELKKLGYYR